MATEPPVPPATPTIPTISVDTASIENLNKASEALGASADKLGQMIGPFQDVVNKMLGGAKRGGEEATGALAQVAGAAEQAKKHTEKLGMDLDGLKKVGSNLTEEFKKISFNKMSASGQQAFDSIKKSVLDMVNATSDNILGMGEVLEHTSKIALFAGLKQGLQQADALSGGALTIQQNLMDVEKAAVQAGVAFGGNFQIADKSVNSVRDALSRSIITTNHLQSAVMEVGKQLRDGMGASIAAQAITGLDKAANSINSTLSAQNVVLLLNNVTGMETSAISKMMDTAYTQLGATIQQTAEMFGTIGLAAERSGIGFQRTADSMMEAAGTLKMWGGTVQAVAPIFNAFSKSLEGTGRAGLTPELLKSYVSGLKELSFGARALLGLQAPGGAAKGAIGAGLEMEAAMEEGEAGMKKITDNLLSSLKQFGGGQIITRQQAIADPNLERTFILQRQLLKSFAGISDPATANRTLEMLKGIEEGGVENRQTAEDKLSDLLKSGEDVGEKQTGMLLKAQYQHMAATISSGAQIAAAIAKDTDVQKHMQNITKAIDQIAMTGEGKTLKQWIKPLEKPTEAAKEKMEAKTKEIKSEKIPEAQAIGIQKAYAPLSLLAQNINTEFPRTLSKAMAGYKVDFKAQEKFEKTGIMSPKLIDNLFMDMSKSINARIKEINDQLQAKSGISKDEQEKLKAERNALQSGLKEQYSQLIKPKADKEQAHEIVQDTKLRRIMQQDIVRQSIFPISKMEPEGIRQTIGSKPSDLLKLGQWLQPQKPQESIKYSTGAQLSKNLSVGGSSEGSKKPEEATKIQVSIQVDQKGRVETVSAFQIDANGIAKIAETVLNKKVSGGTDLPRG